MPSSSLPDPSGRLRWLARVEDAIRVGIYSWITVSGAAVLYHPPRSYGQVADVLTFGWGLLQLLAVVGVVAVLAGKPLWEWRIAGPVAAGILFYALVSFQAVGSEGLGHLPRAADVTALSLAILARFFALWQKVEQAEVRARVQRGMDE